VTEIIIRPANRADVPVIVELLADDMLGAARETVAEPVDPVYLRAFDRIAADAGEELVVAELEGEVVGTLQLTVIPTLGRRGALRAQLEAVRIRTDLRGAGLGRRLVAWAVERARARGCALVQLTSDKRRVDAHRFYASLGFETSSVGMRLML
jgi:GNAT superfamily N-acetyltransferase